MILDDFHAACVAGLDDAFVNNGKLVGIEALPMQDALDVDASYRPPAMDLTLEKVWSVMRRAPLDTQSEAIALYSRGFCATAMGLLEATAPEAQDFV